MRFRKPQLTKGWRRRTVGVVAATLALPMAAGLMAPSVASAQPGNGNPDPYSRVTQDCVAAPGGVGCINVKIFHAIGGSNAAVYMLDGIRARDDYSGWEAETNAAWLSNRNVNVIMPIGGQSSFYTDWISPSNFNGQRYTYKWETFLTQNLPDFLAGRFGIKRTNNGVMGLSMGGSAALTLAAYHRDQFGYAGSLSGYLNISAPGMREAIRVSMLDAGGYNVDAMWGPPWSPAWLRNDPFVFADRLRGLPMYIGAGSGLPGPHDRPNSAVGVFNTTTSMGLEALALANTRAFQVRLATLGIDARYSFPNSGTHTWGYWQDQMWDMADAMVAQVNS